MSQITDYEVQLTIDAANPNGFVVYIIADGDPCEFIIDAGNCLILDAIHGDLNYRPPIIPKINTSAHEMTLKHQTWVCSYSLHLHGGAIINQNP